MTVAAAATRLHRLPAPDTEPPYDEPVLLRPVRPLPSDGTLPLPFPAPAGPRPVLRVVPDAPEPPVPTPSGTPTLPEVGEWAEMVATAIGQMLSGERSPGQFRHWAVPEAYDLVSRRAALAAQGPRRRAALRAVHICLPADGIAEITTVVHGLARPRALAFRLEARRTRWVCTALELG